MEIIARCVSSLTFRNAQENYSRSRHRRLFICLTHRESSRLIVSSVITRNEINFLLLTYTFFFDVSYREEKILLVGGISPDGVYHRVFYKKTLVTRHRRDFGRDFHTVVNTLLWGMDSLFPSEKPREIESSTGFHSCLSISSIFCHAGCATQRIVNC